MPKNLERRNNVSENKKDNESSILLDELNLKIIKDMMNDADVKNTSLAKRYKSPLSTIQRRRTRLERTILKKRYNMDIRSVGWRQADLLISVGNGNSEEMARKIMTTYTSNLIAVSLRIGDPEINLIAQILYQSTEELHRLIEGIKSIPVVKSVNWSEVVKVVGTDNTRMIDEVFGNKASPTPR